MLCAYSSYLFADFKNLLYNVPKCLCSPKIADLWKPHICRLDSVRLSSSHAASNTNNTDSCGVNKQNPHHQSLRKILRLERVSSCEYK